ncbi:50S ribosomal protein L21 [Xanthobacter autotrophicus DSM 597]|uniref:50S ribosomal protein L21 n=1 Tax=Xanthobacter TaxID=279 RepID=UPI001AE9C8B6|nr:50S ribosomal protein L21 [Xanthobacter flavus]MBP2149361.1 large subunit ribosomal protein L21 [Xanthobacter flavus]
MFAVIKANGKQYRVAAADKITIDHLDAEVGAIFTFPVLMLGGSSVAIGAPHVDGAVVTGEIVEHTRGDKVIAFKKRRRQNSRRKRGFRADLTVVRITEISGLGESVKADAAGVGA